jgi:FkbM family methyltransferase
LKSSAWMKPEYVLQPRRLLRRVTAREVDSEFVDIILPWGLPIRVRPEDALGRALGRLGVYDLAVSETLWRLSDAGETVVDVGANVGYTTAVVAGRLGRSGRVLCLEPHPEIFQELRHNVTCWRERLPGIGFKCLEAAVSDTTGKLILGERPDFKYNRGVASLEISDPTGKGRCFEVSAVRLDDPQVGIETIHLLKVDVEGHESRVFEGARQLLKSRRVRDVIFEEHNEYPTAASNLLEASGYQLYRIHKAFWGPELLRPDSETRRSSWEPTSFLATRDADRARQRLRARGWVILRGKAREG